MTNQTPTEIDTQVTKPLSHKIMELLDHMATKDVDIELLCYVVHQNALGNVVTIGEVARLHRTRMTYGTVRARIHNNPWLKVVPLGPGPRLGSQVLPTDEMFECMTQ